MNKAYPIFALLVIGALVGTGMMAEAGPGFLLDFPSIVLLVVLWSLMSMLALSPVACLKTIYHGFRPTIASDAEARVALVHVQALGKYLLLSGVLGTMLGSMVLLGTWGNVEEMANGFSVAVLTSFYAILLKAIFLVPLEESLKMELAKREEQS